MTEVNLKPVTEFAPIVEKILQQVFVKLRDLLPEAELQHIGATAVPGSITKGDIDVLIHISRERFENAVEVLKQHFAVNQPENWTATFASFGDDCGYELPLGIQVAVKNSEDDFLLFLRDQLISNPELVAECNYLKRTYAPKGRQEYWKAKDEFFQKILASRKI